MIPQAQLPYRIKREYWKYGSIRADNKN